MQSGSSRPRETSREESWMDSPRRRTEPERGARIEASRRDVDAEPSESPKVTSRAKDTKVDVSGLNPRAAIFDFVDSQEPPNADPHVRWCGGRGLDPPGYPIEPCIFLLLPFLIDQTARVNNESDATHT